MWKSGTFALTLMLVVCASLPAAADDLQAAIIGQWEEAQPPRMILEFRSGGFVVIKDPNLQTRDPYEYSVLDGNHIRFLGGVVAEVAIDGDTLTIQQNGSITRYRRVP
jgi:hypothetical protein